MNPFPANQAPLHHLTQACIFHINDCRPDRQVTLPAVCDRLQEIAGVHAQQLGVGIQSLQAQGATWFLTELRIRINRLPRYQEPVQLTTWPSGARGKLIAVRDFVLTTPTGEVLLEATSEWVMIDIASHKLMRLTDPVKALASETGYRLTITSTQWPKPTLTLEPCLEMTSQVRRSEIDENQHVNNCHYSQWAFETIPLDHYFTATPSWYAIRYIKSAVLGDAITSTTTQATEGDTLHLYHNITHATDHVSLATAYSCYRSPSHV